LADSKGRQAAFPGRRRRRQADHRDGAGKPAQRDRPGLDRRDLGRARGRFADRSADGCGRREGRHFRDLAAWRRRRRRWMAVARAAADRPSRRLAYYCRARTDFDASDAKAAPGGALLRKRGSAMDVAVVITFYRDDKFFPEALASVLAQTRVPDEIIVVDDASPEGE